MSDTLLTKKMLAELLHTSPSYIDNQIHLQRESITIPPSIKLGRKRLWLESVVQEWLQAKHAESVAAITQHRSMASIRK